MTEETVTRLDYSKPPPGFRISGPPSHSEHTQAAICDAWACYKASNDPPGMWVERVRPPTDAPRGAASVWWTYYVGGGGLFCLFAKPDEAAARAAAWAWYDRRLALVERIGPHGTARSHVWWRVSVSAPDPWPRCLTWSDEQVAEVERWLVDSTAEMPEVLRG